jgi:hypothetical protein
MLDHSHDRHVDRVPAEARHASFGKVLPFDVPGSIPIRVNLIAAGQAQENRLSRSIPLMHEAASGAPLRRVTRIDANHFAPDFLCLVGREGSKLPVTPGMMPPALFPAPLLCPAADVGEVFEDNNAARFHALDNPFAQNMVAIFPKPCLPAAYLLQMTLCRLAAFGLKLATKPEVPLFKAQLALGRYDHLELRSNGGIEAGAGCRSVLESDEMEPSQVIVEVFGCHAAPGAQEGLDPLM